MPLFPDEGEGELGLRRPDGLCGTRPRSEPVSFEEVRVWVPRNPRVVNRGEHNLCLGFSPPQKANKGSKNLERLKKKLSEQESLLLLMSPNMAFRVHNRNGKVSDLLDF